MGKRAAFAILVSTLVAFVQAAPVDEALPNAPFSSRGSDKYSHDESIVDLGYGIYNGTYNSTLNQYSWLGIPYARSTAETRWQLPQEPHKNRSGIIQVTSPGNACPGATDAPYQPDFNYTGSEDCLLVYVVKPKGAKNLPVFVWIHGGGYGEGSANSDYTQLVKASNNGFVTVAIQYRLGAFGFAAGADIKRNGVTNLGLYDQHFGLKWVQKYARQFGGDPNHVTIGGESAGGGSVMLQGLAFGGREGNSLFQNLIAASPYLPTQPNVDDEEPTSSYLRLAKLAGCYSGPTEGQAKTFRPDGSILKCLRGKDSATLQQANSIASASVLFGQWAFIPVTDGKFLQDLPSRQLASGRLNGKRLLCANNADEGPAFTPQNITTEDNFENFVHTIFPRLNAEGFKSILAAYPSRAGTQSEPTTRYGTLGNTGLTALDVSPFAIGQQQRANDFYAEATFVCPSYWMSDAYRTAYHYQFSVLPASHGADVGPEFGLSAPNIGSAFSAAFTSIWYNFIIRNNPGSSTSPIGAVRSFPPWHSSGYGGRSMLNLNQTGGTPSTTVNAAGITVNYFIDPGLQPDIHQVDANSWEGGRGQRCDLLRQLGSQLQE